MAREAGDVLDGTTKGAGVAGADEAGGSLQETGGRGGEETPLAGTLGIGGRVHSERDALISRGHKLHPKKQTEPVLLVWVSLLIVMNLYNIDEIKRIIIAR